MVIRKYRNYNDATFVLNANVVGWNTYLNHKDSLNYNSFIFGNSCTMAFKCTEWEKHLGKDDRAIRLYCEAENAASIYDKLKALDESGANVKNALLIIDNTIFTESEIRYGAWRVLPPELSNESNLKFQLTFLQTFMTPNFFIKYIDYNLFHEIRKGMSGVINANYGRMDSLNCDFYNPTEFDIAEKKEAYWTENAAHFKFKRELDIEQSQAITDRGKSILEDINLICKKQGTNIKLILTPNFHRQRINSKDKAVMESIFGKENVFDFTQNKEYSDKHYFYENVHFRPLLGEVLMQKVYEQSNNSLN